MTRSEAGKLGYIKNKDFLQKRRENKTKEVLDKFNNQNKKCLECKNSIPFEKRFNKFCCQSCSARYNNKKRKKKIRICLNCKTETKNKRKGTYCSQKCQQEFQNNQYIEKWKRGEISGGIQEGDYLSATIRKYLFKKFENKCYKCGWSQMNPTSGRIPLTVNHIDGNPCNHKEENLELLCPNCHSLTSNFGSLNRGNGRKSRYKR